MKPLTDVEQISALCDDFCERNFTEENIKLWCLSAGWPRKIYQDFYDCGLGSYVLPIVAGGQDCPFVNRVAILERLTRSAGVTLPIQSDMVALALIGSMRVQSQAEITEDLFPKQGTVLFSQAFTEPGAGTDIQAIKTVISAEGDNLYLDGQKTFVSAGQFSPRTLVLARDPVCGLADGGMSLWLVALDLPGISTMPIKTIGQEMLCPAAIKFDHVLLDPKWQIQTEGKLNAILKRQFALGRTLVAASSMGLAKAAMDDALSYAAKHKIKGRILGSLPQTQEKIADMEIRIRAMDMFVTEAALAADSDDVEDLALKTTLMKAYVPTSATEVASEALQIFGGIGYTSETRVSRIWRDCRGNQIAQGTDEVMAHYISTSLVKKAAFGKLNR